jgi:hypothetical protein
VLADRKRDRPTNNNSSIRIDRAVRRAVKGRIRFAFPFFNLSTVPTHIEEEEEENAAMAA